MSADNYTLGCNPCTDLSCPPSVLPIDGFGGSLYDCPFTVPIYNYTYSNVQVTWHFIDTYFYQNRAANVAVCAIGLSFSILTLANIIVLTPSNKRGFLHNILFVGNIFGILRSSIDLRLLTSGYLASSYLAITGDWSSPIWSTSFRILLTIYNLSGCIVLACVQIAFYTLSHGMLAWMRIKYDIQIFYTMVTVLTFVSLFSYCWLVVYSIDQIRFIAFVKQGDSIPQIEQLQWYDTLTYGGRYLLGINLGLWSATFTVSAFVIVWQRRVALFAQQIEQQNKPWPFLARTKRVKSVYEQALKIISIVGVESLFIPLLLCIFQFIPSWPAHTEGLIMPVILALLPILSLFNGGTLRAEFDAGREPAHTGRSSRTATMDGEGPRCTQCGCGDRRIGASGNVNVGPGIGAENGSRRRLDTTVSGGNLTGSQRVVMGGKGDVELAGCEGRWVAEADGLGKGNESGSGSGSAGDNRWIGRRGGAGVYDRELEKIDAIGGEVEELRANLVDGYELR